VPPNDPSRSDSSDDASLASGVRTLSALTIASRVGGLVRDVVTVRIFADTLIGSAFAAAFAIPNLFRRLFGEGALAAAFLPEYAQADEHDPRARDRLASLTVVMLALLTTGLMVVIELGMLLALWLAPEDPDRALSLRLIMVMLPFMPLVCVAAILGAMLQVHGRFAPSAGAPIVLNACMIGAASLHFIGPRFDPTASAYAIGIAAVVAGVAQVGWCARALRDHVSWSRAFDGAGPAARRMLTRFLPMVLGLGTIQLNALIDTMIAMWPNWVGPTIGGIAYPLDERSNAILGYTQRLYQFPLGVFGIAVATAAFPLLSRAAHDGARFGATLADAIRLSAFIGIPASIGLIVVRHDLTRVIFAGGDRGFSETGLDRAAAVLLGYAVAVWAYSLNHVLTRGFYARGRAMTPVKVALLAVGLNLSLNLALIWPLREAGLAWSTAVSAIAQTVILAALIRREGVAKTNAAHEVIRLLRAHALPIVGLLIATTGLVLIWPASARWIPSVLRLAAVAGLGAVAYIGLAAVVRSPELDRLRARTRANAP